MSELGGLVLVVISALWVTFTAMLSQRKRKAPALRPIKPLQRLQKAVAQVVESGDQLHISLGYGSLLEPHNASTIAGLSALEKISKLTVLSDRSPYATSGEGSLVWLSKNMLHAGYREGNSLDLFDPDQARLSGISPFSYTGGLLPLMHDTDISANILIGHFGSEIGLVTEAAHRERTFTVAASDSLPAQAVLYATTPDILIGEELFAVPVYLNAGALHRSSLHTQDLLRWLLIALMVGGAALRILGVI